MIKFLMNLVSSIGNNKFFKFLLGVFDGLTGTFLDENYKLINLYVELVEEIGEYIVENITDNSDSLRLAIIEKWAIELADEQIGAIKLNKGSGKFKLAYELSKQSIINNGKPFNARFRQALELGIIMAVNKLFGKE